MTGYGEAELPLAAGRLRVELRSVNGRHLNVNFRTPASLAPREAEMRDWLRGSLSRGNVNCAVQFAAEGSNGGYRLDEERVAAYVAALRQVGERFGIAGAPTLADVAGMRDLLVRDDVPDTPKDIPTDDLRAVFDLAVERIVGMREDEGRRLEADLEGRLEAMDAALAEVEALAPARLATERDRLRAAVSELAAGVGVDEGRLAQEVAYLAERWDIHEELVRFRSHVALFRELLAATSAEPVGKRLAFLVQEMHREANTIGSKANDAAISHRVVAIKDEIERLREQVENVE